MSERSGFFNSRAILDESGNQVLHEDGSPKFDREYTSVEFAEMFSMVLTTGVRNVGENLKVEARGGMEIAINTGDAMINGYYYRIVDEKKILKIDKCQRNKRIDRVVLTLDLREDEGRLIHARIKKGEMGENPKPRALERNDSFYEICLAEITVFSNSEGISNSEIRDTRIDSNLCGILNSRIEVDTTKLLNQIDTYFDEKKIAWNKTSSDYDKWFVDTKSNYAGWYDSVKAKIWDRAYTDFDNYIYKTGYTYKTEEKGNTITTTIFNSNNKEVLAKKLVFFKSDDLIEEYVIFYEKNIGAKKTTRFIGDIIEEVVDEVDKSAVIKHGDTALSEFFGKWGTFNELG